ncbi:tetratricopeptide repeat protein [Polaromonas sp. YR568]|uniref:O-linked N-acetylglucosamine transferase family protein n=1 Tax=Polaromonas sp. YR568 TaxID=1855301 RepID=UPI00398C1C6F
MTVSLAPQQAAAPMPEPVRGALEQALEKSLELALKYHQCGQVENAETLYRGILDVQPEHPEANFQLGRMAAGMNLAKEGLPHFAVALQGRPEQERYWLAYTDALIQADEIETARHLLALGREHGLQGAAVDAQTERLEERLQERARVVPPQQAAAREGAKAVKTRPASSGNPLRKALPARPEVEKLVSRYKQKRFAEAEALARSLTQRFPSYGFGWKMLGAMLQVQRGPQDAVLPMRKAVDLLPNDAEAHLNLGAVLKALDQPAEAEVSFQRVLEITPEHADAHNELGALCKKQDRLVEAEDHFRQALKARPEFVAAHFNLGMVIAALGRPAQAEPCLLRALELAPAYAQAHLVLAGILKGQEKNAEAEIHCRQALEIKPEFIDAHNELGIVLAKLGRPADAEASYRRALEINPAYFSGHNNLGILLGEQNRLIEAEESFRRALEIRPDDVSLYSGLLFSMSQNDAVDAAVLFAEHRRFGAHFEAPLRAQRLQHGNSREPERRLQVGFVSGDLYHHAVASFIEPVWANLAASAGLSLHAYSNHTTHDGVSQRLRSHVKRWNPVTGLSDAALAEKIRADGIDILIDLSGHTARHRLLSFARKPAPVQVSWMGYPGTTGMSSMDYYLSDRFLLPPGQFDDQFTEKLVHLPANAPFLPTAGAPAVNELPALGKGYLTFGSFNRPSKISRAVIALWSQVLRAMPTSRMVLGAMPPDGQYDALIAWFAEEGIARERLDFHPRTSMTDYLALHHQVDMCLDTFPYNGGTTTLHALWMGVPTLTLAGSTVAGRSGAGVLGHVGLNEFVAQAPAEFVREGLSLAADLPMLAGLRAGLRERFAQSVPGQPALIAAGLERALRAMWRRWCLDLPPESFDVTQA